MLQALFHQDQLALRTKAKFNRFEVIFRSSRYGLNIWTTLPLRSYRTRPLRPCCSARISTNTRSLYGNASFCLEIVICLTSPLISPRRETVSFCRSVQRFASIATVDRSKNQV